MSKLPTRTQWGKAVAQWQLLKTTDYRSECCEFEPWSLQAADRPLSEALKPQLLNYITKSDQAKSLLSWASA